MDRQATIGRVAELASKAAEEGAQLVVFPEVFVPGPPVWIDTARIRDEDEEWYALLADQAVVVPSAATEELERRFFDPVGHYNRPDVFRLAVDTAARPAVVETASNLDQ